MTGHSSMSLWMEEAIRLAKVAGTQNEVPVGAILVVGSEVIGMGYNKRETRKRVWAHAEMVALEEYHSTYHEWRVPENTSLVVTVEPCLMCVGALLSARVRNIYYGCQDPKGAGLRRILPLIEEGIYDHRFSTIEGGVLGDVCADLLHAFFEKRRREKRENSLSA